MLSRMGAQGSKKPRLKLPLKARPRTNNVFTAQIQGLEKQSPPLDRTCVKKFAAIFNLTQRPPKKLAVYMNNQFTSKEIQMVFKHMKSCPTSLIRQMQTTPH